MKILVLNSGSSSIKFGLFEMDSRQSLASGLIEQIGEASGHGKLSTAEGEAIERQQPIADHQAGLTLMAELLQQSGVLSSFHELDGIGHRVVHGGEAFRLPTLIDQPVIDTIRQLIPLAPLHNPANLAGIETAMAQAAEVPQVAVFDTAFHQTIPEKAYLYALPHEFYEQHQVRRYGFHGTSHYYVAKQAAAFIGKPLEQLNLITMHLGNGASACAIEKGQSVDTSMGMTPLEGLVMGTRSGDMDPAIIFYLARQLGLDIDQLDALVNKQSGLKGLCGANDVRTVIADAKGGDYWSEKALSLFAYRIRKYIGAYAAVLGHVDAIVFTGGIGEHSAYLRERICVGLAESLGLLVDMEKDNWDQQSIRSVHLPESKIQLLVVPTYEELEIAEQTLGVIQGQLL
ncbi:acetate/propionate family kinase [Oceanobacter mangrovi]|uniref:acetate/propionate family kinase n=1 Tax=Oceanobacter mangrovi TaxID=2862510 RepID=UPI001C8EBAAC|nr:acetate kinase [Oceanobacter mangrovi]